MKTHTPKPILILLIGFMLSFKFGLTQNNKASLRPNSDGSGHAIGMTIPRVASVDIEGEDGSTLHLSPINPDEAGEQLDFSTAQDASLWLNYSSIVDSDTQEKRTVTVAISDGSLPAGTQLSVAARPGRNNGAGTLGVPIDESVWLDDTEQPLITQIGSCYTGDGAESGHQLVYRLAQQPGNYHLLNADQNSRLSVTYTLTNN